MYIHLMKTNFSVQVLNIYILIHHHLIKLLLKLYKNFEKIIQLPFKNNKGNKRGITRMA